MIRKQYSKHFSFLFILILIICTGTPSSTGTLQGREPEVLRSLNNVVPQAMNHFTHTPVDPSWIIHWKDTVEPDPDFYQNSQVIAQYPLTKVMVAKPKQNIDPKTWVHQIEQSAAIDYIQVNQRYKAANAPDDPLLSNQKYLQQIHMEQAWDVETENTALTIAIIDTGVDLKHRDLMDHLVPGVNLINSAKSPQDDNGHGTSVAGVIAAVANNDTGVAGILWKARIMPIKALEADGTGDEASLGEGITYAVSHGAKIVVLSLGLNKFSPFMQSIVKNAEDQGVLVIAAAGNEGNSVKYPAAYSTVLAVGGVDGDNIVVGSSNFGPELDIVAPWRVFTTANGGGYEYRDGTSLAAPQVAAVCALVWKKYPQMKPYQLRNLIRQTAEDLGSPGWDSHYGYGLLRADLALKEIPKEDRFEPNDESKSAKSLPLNKVNDGTLNSNKDFDWYILDASYDGKVQLNITHDFKQGKLELHHYSKLNQAPVIFKDKLAEGISLSVTKGINYIKLQFSQSDRLQTKPMPYQMLTQFQIYRDAFEDNDRKYKAFVLSDRENTIKGTFDHIDDVDWFLVRIQQTGTLKLKLTVDTARIDPVLQIEHSDDKIIVIDKMGDGETETLQTMNVEPGDYYFRVSNFKEYSYPVAGEYTVELNYTTNFVDPHEPNDRSYEATEMKSNVDYTGVLEQDKDTDWFKFKVDVDSLVSIKMWNIPLDRTKELVLQDNTLKVIKSLVNNSTNYISRTEIAYSTKLTPGTYYIRLAGDENVQHQRYNLKVSVDPLISGFADIANHWARGVIVKLTDLKIINGYGDYRFAPDQSISREEAATVAAKAFKRSDAPMIAFSDVDSSQWSYNYIVDATQAGVLNGYLDGTFRPANPLTRMEMVMIMANALKQKEWLATHIPTYGSPFTDVNTDYWGISTLWAMKSQGWIDGFTDGSFRAEQTATRAEFVQILSKILF